MTTPTTSDTKLGGTRTPATIPPHTPGTGTITSPPTPLTIVANARAAVGTPFRHQGRVPGEHGGLDCLGLIRTSYLGATEILGSSQEPQPQFPDFRAYGPSPTYREVEHISHHILNTYLESPSIDSTLQPFPGCVLGFNMGTYYPQHLGIYTDDDTFIHAVAEVPWKVVEIDLRDYWQQALWCIFKYKDVDYG